MFYYNVDLTETVRGRGPSPSQIIVLIQRLPDDSLTAALANGGREHFGWSASRHILADIFDAVNQNTRASGNWGKKAAPKIDPWPRPKASRMEKKKKPVTVADLYARFSRR